MKSSRHLHVSAPGVGSYQQITPFQKQMVFNLISEGSEQSMKQLPLNELNLVIKTELPSSSSLDVSKLKIEMPMIF